MLSRALASHSANIHDIIKLQENEKRSDPIKSWALCTKWLQCKICGNKTAFKCSECIPSLSLCNNGVCIKLHCLVIQNETMMATLWTKCISLNKSDMSHDSTWLTQVMSFQAHLINSHLSFSFPIPYLSLFYIVGKFIKSDCWTLVYRLLEEIECFSSFL